MHQFSKLDFDQASLILRVTLGVFFLIAGLAQLGVFVGLTDSVSGFGIAESANAGSFVVVLFPWVEIVLGFLLIVGLATTLAAFLVGLISFLLMVVNGFTVGASLSKEILFVAVALALMLMGAGAHSLDAKTRGKKRRRKKN